MKRERECVCQRLDFHGKKGIPEFDLPGFRFHPTEQELVGFYLKNMAQGKPMNFNVIRMLDLYRYDPWELPGLSPLGERELFFFVPRGKNGSGRNNRIAVSGYWKATGSDRQIHNGRVRCIGVRKTLVFYLGRAPRGQKTDWVMKEYRMPEHHKPKVEIVVCRIYRKATPLKWLEERALDHVEDLPSADDVDDSDCSDKPQARRICSPPPVDRKLNNKDGARGERCAILSSATAECQETKRIPATRQLRIVPDLCQHTGEAASSSAEDIYAAHTEVWSFTAPNNSDIHGGLIDPTFEAFADDDKCEGFSVCRSGSNVRFMDLLDSSSDCSCLDPSFPDLLIDGESTRVEKELQVAPELSVNYFYNEETLHHLNLNLESKYPSRDL